MSNVLYLKTEKYFYPTFIMFDKNKLTSIRVETFECEVKTYYDLQELNGALGRRYVGGYDDCDKYEFDQALNKFEATLKDIKEQL